MNSRFIELGLQDLFDYGDYFHAGASQSFFKLLNDYCSNLPIVTLVYIVSAKLQGSIVKCGRVYQYIAKPWQFDIGLDSDN